MSSSDLVVIDSDSDVEEVQDLPDVLVGSGEYEIVGIRYYSGVAHPGEFVTLVREPHNPYDSMAIRVDNLRGEKVGHIKATMAKNLSPIMDRGNSLGVRLEGTIPRSGNAYTLPLVLDFYSTNASDEQARVAAQNLRTQLRGDYRFRLRLEFGGSSASAPGKIPKEEAVTVAKKKMDWNAQQAALDEMFDQHLKDQYKDLPNIAMPDCFSGLTLMEHQIQGIKWLVKRETNPAPAPFYKKVKEKKQTMYLCEITQSSQSQPPNPIRGSLMCDEMGLGKTIQTIGLILLAPPAGVVYKVPESPVAANATKRCTLIVCPVSVMGNWTEQIETFVTPGVLNVEHYHGINRDAILPEVKAGNVDILLVSYNTLASDFDTSGHGGGGPKKKRAKRDSIFDIDFHRIVLDEAHMIRNSKTRAFKAVCQIKADRKLGLTGTPFVNTADDIFSLVSFIGVEPLNEKMIFTRAITQPIKNGDDLGLTRLRTTMGFLSLRRSKANVNTKLVEKDVSLCSVEFVDDAHKRVNDALFGTVRVAMEAILGDDDSKALKNYSVIFEKLLRLRQACCSGLLLTQERRNVAIKMWDEMNEKKSASKKLTAEEGLRLLEKLKGAFEEESGGSLPECGICLMEFALESDAVALKGCGHIFCKLCIGHVVAKSSKKCPYCRAPFTEKDIVGYCQAASAASEEVTEKTASSDLIFGTPPKIKALLLSIEGMKGDEKGVIFSQFTSHLDVIGKCLKEAGHNFVRIDGSVSAPKRIAAMNSFNADVADSPRFILCSLLAAGTGINLTRANWCFMMDVWWNDAVESQAMDRVHRISQTRKVNVLRFVMKGSIEERIIAVQERKSLQAKGALQKLKGDEKRKALIGDLSSLLDIKAE